METKHDRPQHTPAPWYWADTVPDAPKNHRMIVDADGFTIAEPSPMSEANARLIAAAPDLLAVVEMVHDIWSHDQTENLHPESPRAILRAALKKAKGEI